MNRRRKSGNSKDLMEFTCFAKVYTLVEDRSFLASTFKISKSQMFTVLSSSHKVSVGRR